VSSPDLLIGTATSDDAAVFKLTEEIALVQTVDFFPPIVDDPYAYGAIAVANALSDVYAKGGRPLLGLNIVCFPAALPKDILGRVLRGGADKAAEAGLLIVGGHSINDNEPKYGLCVTGLINPQEVVTNAGARPGDVLILTKPLGSGIITTGIDQGMVAAATISKAVEVMAALNAQAAEAMRKVGVHACTDVTGYGLLGHLRWMVEGSGLPARVSLSQVPVLEGTEDLIAQGTIPGGTRRNLKSLERVVRWDRRVSEHGRILLADAQTSGGLLLAVPPDRLERLLAALAEAGVQGAAVIGEFARDGGGAISVLP